MLFIEDKSFKNLFNLLNVESFISYPIIKATLLQPSDYFSAILNFLENEILVLENSPENKN